MPVIFWILFAPRLAQLATGDHGPAVVERVGAGVTAPRVLFKVDPKYSPDATHTGIQGTVVLEIVVSDRGMATDIQVLSPLGFGLDECAQEAIKKWRFDPGKKNGKPVNILATVEVNFRLGSVPFDSKGEHLRTAFNVALGQLRQQDEKKAEQGLKTMKDLAGKQFPPAMFALGALYETGNRVDRDPSQALSLIAKAADHHYAPALYELGALYIEGKLAPRDVERALHLMNEAARLGNQQAQHALGLRYENGDGVERDPDRARRYFRLCAASGTPECQLHLGQMLLALPDRKERDYVQAVAWLLLARVMLPQARQVVEAEMPNLTPAQYTAAQKLQAVLVHKQ